MAKKPNKRQALTMKAREGVRKMDPARLVEKPTKRSNKKDVDERITPATFSLHPRQIAWIKHTTEQLGKAGYPKPGLSLVVQEAVFRMEEAVGNKTPGELMTDILDRQAARVKARQEKE